MRQDTPDWLHEVRRYGAHESPIIHIDTRVPVWTAYDIAELGYGDTIDRHESTGDSDSRERFVCASTGV